MKKVSVIIPAYNETCRIASTVSAVKSIPEVGEVLVVDDGSSDNTAAEAERAGASVILMPVNSGKGAALTRGAYSVKFDTIALLDGDLGPSAEEGRLLMLPVLENSVDMTIAGFPSPKKGGFGLVKGFAAAVIKIFTGLKVKSPLSGQRVMTGEVLEKVLPFASGYGVELDLTLKAGRMGYKIKEVPVKMQHHETGRDIKGFIHRGKQFVHILRVLACTSWQRA
ncbi:MAG: glycosyltransferase family 2 protein [Clostridiales bacterium]|nr:glycosyltransferase family 2 protein [Clostridiales bacterium]MCF8021196.1 glycosyltransferase family 2 protein [Clostridiales bacterium]